MPHTLFRPAQITKPGGAFPTVARPHYFDRNPSKIVQRASSAPGAAATSATGLNPYTVPAGRRAFVEIVWLRVHNRSAVTLDEVAEITLKYTPSGGSAVPIKRAGLEPNDHANTSDESSPTLGLMMAGDKLHADTTVLNSAAGSDVELNFALVATEYDA